MIGIDGGQIGQSELVGFRQRHLEGQRIDYLELVGARHRPREELSLAEHRRRHGTVERPLDVFSGDRRAILKLGILAQMKCDFHCVGADVIGFRELTGDFVEIEHPPSVELLAAK